MNELLGRVRVLWNGLAAREQMLVGAAGGLLAVLLLVFGIVLPVVATTERAVEDADAAEQQLAMMQRMKREWDGLHQRLESVESRIRASGQRENLLTVLESLARQAGVKPTSMEKRQSGESEQYEETKVEVSLKNVSLKQAVDYLSSIEAAVQPLSVKSLRIKRRPGQRRGASDAAVDLLDVTFSVSSFRPL
ncbi:MAG: type II secretion system protein M [Deltaproteobacteria bacterium]|nr:type II secretion system protein M [Deltaproteobacteria bacterium]